MQDLTTLRHSILMMRPLCALFSNAWSLTGQVCMVKGGIMLVIGGSVQANLNGMAMAGRHHPVQESHRGKTRWRHNLQKWQRQLQSMCHFLLLMCVQTSGSPLQACLARQNQTSTRRTSFMEQTLTASSASC